MAAAVVTFGLGAVVSFGAKMFWFDHMLQTQASELHSMPLSDGSSITAAPFTRLHHDIGDEQRVISLAEGKAMFRVAKDPSRPFLVDAGRVMVRATGTKFTVERHGSEVTVTMHEGTVLVSPSDDGEGTFHSESLAADDQWTVSGSSEPTRAHVDSEAALDWSRGRLEFKSGATVGNAAAKFNGYNAIKIVVDEQVCTRQMRGAFDANDPVSFAETVQQTVGVTVVRETPELIRIKQSEHQR